MGRVVHGYEGYVNGRPGVALLNDKQRYALFTEYLNEHIDMFGGFRLCGSQDFPDALVGLQMSEKQVERLLNAGVIELAECNADRLYFKVSDIVDDNGKKHDSMRYEMTLGEGENAEAFVYSKAEYQDLRKECPGDFQAYIQSIVNKPGFMDDLFQNILNKAELDVLGLRAFTERHKNEIYAFSHSIHTDELAVGEVSFTIKAADGDSETFQVQLDTIEQIHMQHWKEAQQERYKRMAASQAGGPEQVKRIRLQ